MFRGLRVIRSNIGYQPMIKFPGASRNQPPIDLSKNSTKVFEAASSSLSGPAISIPSIRFARLT